MQSTSAHPLIARCELGRQNASLRDERASPHNWRCAIASKLARFDRFALVVDAFREIDRAAAARCHLCSSANGIFRIEHGDRLEHVDTAAPGERSAGW